jgi:2-dehydro-3-deoxy-D-arabinonate dehydratase
MKIFKMKNGDILLEEKAAYYRAESENWDSFINDDNLYSKCLALTANAEPISQAIDAADVDAPMQSQELWASGVTYLRSRQERQKESASAGGADFYQRVYEAERPELFFKAARNRVVGPGGEVRIRKDSKWDVPEPELVLMISSRGNIIGYTIGNDMSSRSIEGENPLYLPQAKTYDGCASVGPCIYVPEKAIEPSTKISLCISRDGSSAFEGEIGIDQITRRFEDLAEFLFRECSFPHGALLMTGTGIVPGPDFTLRAGDRVAIQIEGIGELINTVA